jgi:hypothetical protein
LFCFFFDETCLFLTYFFQNPKLQVYFLKLSKIQKLKVMTKSNNHPTFVKSSEGQALGCLPFDLLQPLNVNETPF